MSNTVCKHCRSPITPTSVDVYENVDGYLYHCSTCDNLLYMRPYPPQPDYRLTTDEISYTIHCLGKQMQKLDHAKKQLNSTIAKLEIMLELNEEECNDR